MYDDMFVQKDLGVVEMDVARARARADEIEYSNK